MASSKKKLSHRRKLALIVGNGNYSRRFNRLSRSANYVNDLSDLLGAIDFDVTMRNNIDKEIMERIQDFADKINDDDLILLYFFGHGYKVDDNNYVIPVDDKEVAADEDIVEYGTNVERILKKLRERNPSCVVILILDCCRPYLLKNVKTPDSEIKGEGLHEMKAPTGTFIQFACAANETVNNDLFTKHLLENIAQENMDIPNIFRRIAADVFRESKEKQHPLSINGLLSHEHIYLNQVRNPIRNISKDAKWKCDAHTIAGTKDFGSTMNMLHCPKGLYVDSNQTIFIADSLNHRIMKYRRDATSGQRIVGESIQGYTSTLLNEPSNVIFDPVSKSLIICDYHNRRVLQWFPRSKTCTTTIKENIACFGLAMDDEGSLYVSDTERHEVRRYRPSTKYGTVVAGGHGQGRRRDQLNHPTYICIGDDQSVYVSDSWNDRVMKWDKNAEKGVVVAGDKGKGNERTQLNCPAGVVVDRLGTLYVADHWNDRVMRWRNGQLPDIIAGRGLPGNNANELNGPEGLAFDRDGNLYVADSNNHRIQRFNIH